MKPANLIVVPRDEMRSIVRDGQVLDPLLIPAKSVAIARQVGLRREPDRYRRSCRVCQQPISTKEQFLEILIERPPNGVRMKGFLHVHECLSPGRELPGSEPLPLCHDQARQFRENHPERLSEIDFMVEDDFEMNEAEEMGFNEVPKVMHLSTQWKRSCPVCDDDDLLNFEVLCNHLIRNHSYRCMHIGQETNRDASSGTLMQATAAVLFAPGDLSSESTLGVPAALTTEEQQRLQSAIDSDAVMTQELAELEKKRFRRALYEAMLLTLSRT